MFLDSLRDGLDSQDLLNHIFDEANRLLIDPFVDMVDKLLFPVPYAPETIYRILWGIPVLGRAFWYIYETDEAAQLLRIHNMGHAGIEPPFLSRQ